MGLLDVTNSKILVADDDELSLEMLSSVLERMGHIV